MGLADVEGAAAALAPAGVAYDEAIVAVGNDAERAHLARRRAELGG